MASQLRAWVQASRPLAQGNIAPALLYGQALAVAATGSFHWSALVWAHLFGVLDQLFILFVNDWSDVHTDDSNTTHGPFSGGSRVVQEGKLSRQDLANGALVVMVALLGLAMTTAAALARPHLWHLTLAGIVLVWAYSLGPLRLAYRGHGEGLQAAGVGLILPAFGYLMQGGTLDTLPPLALLGCLLLGYAGNITTSLPDHPSDSADNKRSYAVRRGPRKARVESLIILALGAVLVGLGTPGLSTTHRVLVIAIPLALLATNLRRVENADATARRQVTLFVLTNGAAIAAAWLVTAGLLFAAR